MQDLPFPGTAMSAGPKDGGLDSFSAHFPLPLTCCLQPLASEDQESYGFKVLVVSSFQYNLRQHGRPGM